MHSKYPTVKLTIVILMIIFNISKWLTHPLINVCGVLRPPILVIDYNQHGRIYVTFKYNISMCNICIFTVIPTVV